MKLTHLDLYQDLLLEKSGKSINQDQGYLIESRVSPLLKELGFKDLEELTGILMGVPEPHISSAVVEAMMNYDSAFFRDHAPFKTLHERLIPDILTGKKRGKKLRIWSAGTAKGQEAFSLAIIVSKLLEQLAPFKYEILASDLSVDILDQAKSGTYTQNEVQRGIPTRVLLEYFTRNGKLWTVNPSVKSMVKFKPFNLLDSLYALDKFDVILCRYVLCDFDPNVAKKTIERLSQALNDGGVLLLGQGESTFVDCDALQAHPDHKGFFIKV